MRKLTFILSFTALITSTALADPSDIQPPQSEQNVISIVNQQSAAYDSGANEMAKGAARPRRAALLCKTLPTKTAKDWVGTVETLSSTNDGHGVFGVRIDQHVTIATTNNSMSEALSNMKTLISPADPIFPVVSSLHEGQQVKFSGRFGSSDDDCLDETSMTQGGSMHDPEFEFKFTAVTPLAQ